MRKREDAITVQIAKNIALLRKIYGLTQLKLGSLIGVDPDTVRSWEACRRRADEELIIKMANLLNLEGGWLWFYQSHEGLAAKAEADDFTPQEKLVLKKLLNKLAVGGGLTNLEVEPACVNEGPRMPAPRHLRALENLSNVAFEFPHN